MQGRKIKHKETQETFDFLQFEYSSINEIGYMQSIALTVIVEDKEGNICCFLADDMQFVKEEPTFKLDTTDFNLKIKKLTEESKEYQEYLELKKLRDENMFKIQPSPFFEKYKVTCSKSETTGTTGIDMMKHKAESMPNLQNTVEVWACMDEDGVINISDENNFYKSACLCWNNNDNLFLATESEDFKKAFKGIQWEDDEPKKFRITVEKI